MSSKKNTTRKNRKKEDPEEEEEEEENIKEIELQENNHLLTNPILEKKIDLNQLAIVIENKIKNLEPRYTYTTVNSHTHIEIDGIPVTIYIGKDRNKDTYKFQMIAEYGNIKSEDTCRDDRDIAIHSGNAYKNVLSILEHIEEVKNSYKLIDNELLSPKTMELIKLQRKIYPIPSDKNCSVCYEPTIEYTVCKHPICFRCRYTCIRSNNILCPICRNGELKLFPTELAAENE